jgi:hypothetical protein
MQSPELPSTRKLAKATIVAILAAAAILVTIVLPAEYGIDPLGTGAALGLRALSDSASAQEQELAPASGDGALKPVQEGPVAHFGGQYKVDSTTFTLGPYEYVEYKYRLEQGASMLYSWVSSDAVVHDFHGEADGTARAETSFDKRQIRQANGMLLAPFAGIHGWYWENTGGSPITVTLTTAGFYSSAIEIRSDRTRRVHELKTPVPPASTRRIDRARPHL